MILKQRLRERREALGLSPDDVTGQVRGVNSANTIRNYEKDPGPTPQADTLVNLARVYQTTVAYLIGEIDDPDWRPGQPLGSAVAAEPFFRSDVNLPPDEAQQLMRRLELVRRERELIREEQRIQDLLNKANSKGS